MTIIHKTLLLDQSAWDLVLDAAGNIACASAPYSIPQDVASASRTFRGECAYDASQGVPYWQSVLGYYPAAQVISSAFEDAAKSVPDVAQARVIITQYDKRTLQGQIQIIDTDGQSAGVSFGD